MREEFEHTTKYFAGITNDGMILWSLGYIVGAIVGYFASFWVAVFTTLALTAAFLLFKGFSERKHGRRVNVTLPERLIVELNNNDTQV